MRIRLITVGTKMPGWVNAGVNEYVKRLAAGVRLQLIEVPLGRRSKGGDIQRAILKESSQILGHISRDDYVVALDIGGASWGTEELADRLAGWQMSGGDVAMLVGGPDGLSKECLQRADQRWSLSNLTFPHPLVRIIIAEQIYRAWTIRANHPYHR